MNSLESLLKQRIDAESADFCEKNFTLIHIIRTHYDLLTEQLFPLLKAQRKGCYDALKEILAKAGRSESTESIRLAMWKVRRERQGIKAQRNAAPASKGKEPGRPQLTAVSGQRPPVALEIPRVQPPGESLSGQAGGLTWSIEPLPGKASAKRVVFNGLVVDHNPFKLASSIRPTVTQLAYAQDKAALSETLTFMRSFMELLGRKSHGVGLEMTPLDWPTGERALVDIIKDALRT